MRKIDLIILVPLVRLDGQLVSSGLADQTDYVLHIKTTGYKLTFKIIQQLWITGRITGSDIVNRLNDAYSKQITPNTVHITAGKVLVVLRSHPGSQPVSARKRCVIFKLCRIRKIRCRYLPGPFVLDVSSLHILDDFV